MEMRPRYAPIAALCLALGASCGLEQGVGHDGQYVFSAEAEVADTTPYPLRHQLQIEADDRRGVALVYAFSGQLGDAGLGLPDLRRLARDFGGFQMAFQPSAERYTRKTLYGRKSPLSVYLPDGSEELLRALDDDYLQRSGAIRFLQSVESDDYRVDAYFGPIAYAGELPSLRVDLSPGVFEVAPQLPAAELTVEVTADSMTVNYGTLPADYLLVELGQDIVEREQPDEPVEALVRTSMLPGTPYQVGEPLLTSAAEQGCWSTDRPLWVRLTQVWREYLPDAAGDRALIVQRATSVQLEPETWNPLTMELHPAPYCERYSPP